MPRKKKEADLKIFNLELAAKTAKKLMAEANKDGAMIMIVEGLIKDGYCNYSYEIVTGVNAGFTHNVKGKTGIVHDDMRNAFAKLNIVQG